MVLIIGAFVAGITVAPPFVSAATKVALVIIGNTEAEPVPVAGTVTVGNLPAIQPVSGSVNVGNFPSTQPVSGTVGISGTPNVNVSNFPSTQPVSGTVGISGTPNVNVSNFPSTQPVSGTLGVAEETVALYYKEGTIAPAGLGHLLQNQGDLFLDISAYKSVAFYFQAYLGGASYRCQVSTTDPDYQASFPLGEFTNVDAFSAHVIDPAPLLLGLACANLGSVEMTYRVLVTGRTN